MARTAKPERLQAIYQKCEEYPGKRAGFLAALLGWHRSDVMRSLPNLEVNGYLLSEDDQGRLWPYRKRK